MSNEQQRLLRIATWNVARPSGAASARTRRIQTHLEAVNADVWILTESRLDLAPGPDYRAVATAESPEDRSCDERWTIIWSRLPILASPGTTDSRRAVCAVLDAGDARKLVVYATVLPWLGSRWRDHNPPLAFAAAWTGQQADCARLTAKCSESAFCLAGDFNQDLDERHYYGSGRGKQLLRDALAELELHCVTGGTGDPVATVTGGKASSIDHLCFSRHLSTIEVGSWPKPDQLGSTLSDHFGVYADCRWKPSYE